MVAHASARKNRAPQRGSRSRRSSLDTGDIDEKETEEKPVSKHIRSNVASERAWENTSSDPVPPAAGMHLLNAEALPSGAERTAPALGAAASFPRAAPSPGTSAPPPIAARSLCASSPSSANTPCATHSLPPGASTRANSASNAGIDHARFKTLLIYTRSNTAFPIPAPERFSGSACEKRK